MPDASKENAFSKPIYALLLFSLAAAGIVLVWVSTRWGAFLSDDSYGYIQPARSFLAGQPFAPSHWFPPMLPIVLIPLGWLGLEPLVGIRVLNTGLFGVNILLSALLVRKLGMARGFALFAAAIVLLSENTLETHGWAMSEALYITFVLLALIVLQPYFSPGRPRSLAWLMGSAAIASLAGLTRLVGLMLVLSVGFGLLFINPSRRWPQRIRDAILYGVVGNIAPGLYYLYNQLTIGRIHGFSQYNAPPLTWNNVIWYIYSTLSWFIPGRLLHNREVLVAAGVLVLIVVGGVAFWLRHKAALTQRKADLFPKVFWIMLVFVAANYAMLAVARGLNQSAAFNMRYLIPPLTVFWLALVYSLNLLWKFGRRFTRLAVTGVCVIYLGYYGLRSTELVRNLHRTGLGYANVGWHQSETVRYIKSQPEIKLVASGDYGIYFWTGRLPLSIAAFGGIDGLHTYLCQNNSLLVLMKQMPTEIYHMNGADVIRGLSLVQEFNDGSVYRCPGTETLP